MLVTDGFGLSSRLFSREGGRTVWGPAFAGEQSCGAGGAYSYHPGGGRGPVGGRCQLRSALRYCGLSNWAPAFAGVVGKEAGSGLGSRGRERSGVWLWVLTLVRMTVGGVGHGCARSAVEAVLPRRRESSLGPRLRGGTVLWCGWCPPPPPRRRPGPNWGTAVTEGALRYCDLSNWAPAFAGVVPVGPVVERARAVFQCRCGCPRVWWWGRSGRLLSPRDRPETW